MCSSGPASITFGVPHVVCGTTFNICLKSGCVWSSSLTRAHLIKLFQRTCDLFFLSQKLKVEEVTLWGLSGDMSGLELRVVLMTQSRGVRSSGDESPLSPEGQAGPAPHNCPLSVPCLALPSSLAQSSYNCLCCQRRFDINGFLELRGRQGDIEPE